MSFVNPSPGPAAATASDPYAARVDPATWELLRAMPKAELHLHLDGCLRPETALELARQRGLDDGMTLDDIRARLRAPERCANQADLLRAFDLPIALMQDAEALERITAELVEDVAAEGTRYVEIRWAPSLHLERGLPLRGGIAAVVAGARAGTERVAAGGGGVVTRLIAVAMRSHGPETSERVAREAVAFAGEGLTGFDCAGPEEAYPDPLVHRRAFAVARDGGLGITIHAGEWGGAAQVRRALSVDPARIAHGTPAAGDPGLVADLIERDVTLDLCPTSNVQTGIVPELAAHPLPRLARAGVPVTISTDDRTVSGTTLVLECGRALDALGMTLPELWALQRHALRVAFLHDDEVLRASLVAAFDAFASSEPRLRADG